MKNMLKALPMLLMLGTAINVTQAQTLTGKNQNAATQQTGKKEINKSAPVNRTNTNVSTKRTTPVSATTDKNNLSKPTVQQETSPTGKLINRHKVSTSIDKKELSKPTDQTGTTTSTATRPASMPKPTIGTNSTVSGQPPVKQSPLNNKGQLSKPPPTNSGATQVTKENSEKENKYNKQKKHHKHEHHVPNGRAVGWHRNHDEGKKSNER